MKYEIKNRWDGKIIYQDEAESFKALVLAAIKAGADLSYADLSSANLRYADLRYADLSYADLRSADLPAPTMILLALWGELSEQLTADLMLFDASSHPDQTAFQRWADGGPCPYEGVKVQRVANFKESKKLWGAGKPDTIYNLMMRVLKEKTKQS